MVATEKVQYKPDPNDANQTIAVKEVWVESRLYGLRYISSNTVCFFMQPNVTIFRSAVKNFGIERFKQNCLKATDGFNFVLERLHDRQMYLKEIHGKRWQEMRDRSEALRGKLSSPIKLEKSS